MAVADELRKLTELRDSGALSPEEFERAKARILASAHAGGAAAAPAGMPHAMGPADGAGAPLGGASATTGFAAAGASSADGAAAGNPASAAGESLQSALNRLRRSETDRWVSGVCGGLAEVSGVESFIWRIGFALATLLWGVAILVYILLWIFVPLEDPI